VRRLGHAPRALLAAAGNVMGAAPPPGPTLALWLRFGPRARPRHFVLGGT